MKNLFSRTIYAILVGVIVALMLNFFFDLGIIVITIVASAHGACVYYLLLAVQKGWYLQKSKPTNTEPGE